jgi:cytochrome oxidase Cu insertion factor (SCO1/SenC/PrrC family)
MSAQAAESAIAAAQSGLPESEFAVLVDALAADPQRRPQLISLLREDHPLYDQRGAAAIVRMRGWVLLAMARAGVDDAALIFVLEELDTGVDAYLVAAAARAVRSRPRPDAALAPFVMRALVNIRYRDEPVSFEQYGEYAVSTAQTSAVRELLATLAWLGPQARGVLPELEQLRGPGLSRKLRLDLQRALQAIRVDAPSARSCCGAVPDAVETATSWEAESRRGAEPVDAVVLEDQTGEPVTFGEFFHGRPSIVVFFYTRCDNPMKCSLTVAKLARVQKVLAEQGLQEQIRTAAISYDPAFDLPERLRVYGADRGVRMDVHHRMLRAQDDNAALRRHFELGVNFIESLVNRHRIEAYILDAQGRVATCFERLHWDEQEVVARAIAVLGEGGGAGVV